MRVAELEGALLDYWVARAEDLPRPRVDDGVCWVEEPACDGDPAAALDAAFSPSNDWSVGGPIIERERIEISRHDKEPFARVHGEPQRPGTFGPTVLIASMRAYVASKLGEEVEGTPPAT
jgi:hypothetical protein